MKNQLTWVHKSQGQIAGTVYFVGSWPGWLITLLAVVIPLVIAARTRDSLHFSDFFFADIPTIYFICHDINIVGLLQIRLPENEVVRVVIVPMATASTCPRSILRLCIFPRGQNVI